MKVFNIYFEGNLKLFKRSFLLIQNVHVLIKLCDLTYIFFFLLFLAFDFCRFCVVIRFFIPANDLRLRKIFYPRFYPLHYFLILILEKAPVFPFLMFSAKQGNYWYHFYNVFGMTRSLTGDWTRDLSLSKPALYH